MKKELKLKNSIVKVLSFILCSYIMFISITIDSLGNKTYDIVLIIYTILAILSFILLKKYSNAFDDDEKE